MAGKKIRQRIDFGSIWVRQGDESESGKLVLKKAKWTYFDAYIYDKLCETIQNIIYFEYFFEYGKIPTKKSESWF